MSPSPIARDLVVAHTRALKLPGVARVFEALARQAREAHWPHEDYLQEVLSAEQASRHESVIRQRLREARFPEVKTLDTFDFTAADGLNAAQVHALARGAWVTAPENLIFAGPIGTGKTHLAIALGVEATRQKRRVLFTRAADLVRQLLEARDSRELTRLQQRLLRVDVLIVDELGFVPFDRVGGELLFNLITDRYERRATIVTTNLAFAEWVTHENGAIHDSRGVARARLGDFEGAIRDFEAYLAWAPQHLRSEEDIASRKGWIGSLKRGAESFRSGYLRASTCGGASS